MKLLAYVRDTRFKSLDSDKNEIVAYTKVHNHTVTQWYHDINGDRSQYRLLFTDVMNADGIICVSFADVARSMSQLLTLVKFLDNKRKIFISLQELVNTAVDVKFGATLDQLRHFTKTNMSESAHIAAESGAVWGRQRVDIDKDLVMSYVNKGYTVAEIAQKLPDKPSTTTLRRRIKEWNEELK